MSADLPADKRLPASGLPDGLHLDTLKIQRVEDEAGYLVNLGRTQIANAVRDAENAESQANQEILQEEAGARQLAEVAAKEAEIGIVRPIACLNS